MASGLELSDEEVDGEAILVAYRHSERSWNAMASYQDFGEGFRSDLGFVSRVGYRELLVSGERIWWGERGDPYTKLSVGGDASRTEGQDGDLLEEQVAVWGTFSGPLQSSVVLEVAAGTYVYREVEYDQSELSLEGELWPSGNLELGLEVVYGDWIDFSHARPGTFTELEPSFSLRLGRHLEVSGSYEYSALDVDGGTLFETQVGEAKVVYQFTARTFLRTILQYSSILRDPALWLEPVEERSRELFAQLLFSYTLNPQTVVYLGASEGREGGDEVALTARDRTLFVKLGYAWLW